jgi:hypothetical protein
MGYAEMTRRAREIPLTGDFLFFIACAMTI